MSRCLGYAALSIAATGLAETGYLRAPDAIRAVLDAPAPPLLSVSPGGSHALVLRGRRYPPVAEVAAPVLRLAGERINPRTNGPHTAATYHSFELMALTDGRRIPLAVPEGARLSAPLWSPDGESFAVTNTVADGIHLWIGAVRTGEFREIRGIRVNAAYGEPVQWMPGGRKLIVQTIPAGRGAPPAAPLVPAGPVVQEAMGKAGPIRTYQDLLQSAHDEQLFTHYATSQLLVVPADGGAARPFGKPAIFAGMEPSPDGKVLLVRYLHAPYSYVLPAERFPHEVEVWDVASGAATKIASQPMRDRIPIEGVAEGPRLHTWKASEPATLTWIAALDGGNSRKPAPERDRVMTLAAPFGGTASELFRTAFRFTALRWLPDARAIVSETDPVARLNRMSVIGPTGVKVLWTRKTQDRYNDPGTLLTRLRPDGTRVVRVSGSRVFFEGDGASPQGDRPFLDSFDLDAGAKQRLFHCDAESYEQFVAMLDTEGRRIITRRETPLDPPHYLIRAEGKIERKLTSDPDPTPELRKIERRLVTYKRPDGVTLSFTLTLPPDYKPGTRLPTLVWAYPREYGDADTAGQVSGSTKRFTTITGASHLFFALAGYAVLDGATMPVVGDSETANNTYVEQIVASAKAAIDQANELGVADPARVGVGGHSYGAFMTANLLAHSRLFRAGIARSGAYNRTLTPFGFQAERRTIWEAPDVYLRMSPFLQAHKIEAPVLLIHGEADDNQGTFPIQSERLYAAIRGNGGTVRYVVLPGEAHTYRGRESVEHAVAEMIGWFDRWVKPGVAAK